MKRDSAAIEEFLTQARAALPGQRLEPLKVRGFGTSAEISGVIVPLILAGEKTGTFALASEFAADPSLAPAVGDLYLVTHFDGAPACLYRVTEVERVPFEGINHEHVQVEGPSARSVDVWRKIHWDYWGAILRQQGQQPSMQMPVIFHRFEVLFPEPPLRR